MEYNLEKLAICMNKSKSDIVKEAISQYIVSSKILNSSYEVGKALFSKHVSGEENKASMYKSIIMAKVFN